MLSGFSILISGIINMSLHITLVEFSILFYFLSYVALFSTEIVLDIHESNA